VRLGTTATVRLKRALGHFGSGAPTEIFLPGANKKYKGNQTLVLHARGNRNTIPLDTNGFHDHMQRGSCKLKAFSPCFKNSIPFASAQDGNVRDCCHTAGFAPPPQQTSAFALVKVSHSCRRENYFPKNFFLSFPQVNACASMPSSQLKFCCCNSCSTAL
jgi:hypothetical protein